jgi:hypothetical protein
VQLIGSVRTTTGLRVKAKLDTGSYATGIAVPDADMHDLDIIRDPFHGDWNYAFRPRAFGQS